MNACFRWSFFGAGLCLIGLAAPLLGQGPRSGRSGPAEPGMTAAEHTNIQTMVRDHRSLKRVVEDLPNGVKTTTTTTDPALVPILRAHVLQMKDRLEANRPVRQWDPVFRAVFSHADEIQMTVREIPDGIEVLETSENPDVVPLIRAHARKLNSFVEQGHEAVRPPWAGGRGRGRFGRTEASSPASETPSTSVAPKSCPCRCGHGPKSPI